MHPDKLSYWNIWGYSGDNYGMLCDLSYAYSCGLQFMNFSVFTDRHGVEEAGFI
ncbi:uncharacterized protein BDZ99DRAFT_211230 [Mytilinidion resinicola]|uniref:Uncharacterized protein n=1 Tax=Mytilinidion resinicola TaxID=574789 RepID=A0A6A6Y067_9PEZI|nr:uncharacterized protein BDZ99DRAFT_211230 [Mytilinidion resinicola]KAF2801913.1 hypothetical protein BDZ99DRAFT_211230 [Mytilinidion resinicola]